MILPLTYYKTEKEREIQREKLRQLTRESLENFIKDRVSSQVRAMTKEEMVNVIVNKEV